MSQREPTRRILLVDDEAALAWSLSSRLARARPHYLVDTAEDGESALLKLHDHEVDLLVADVRMPGMSGIELIMEAWKLDSDLKVIVMTAFKSPEVDQLIAGSAIRYIEKPFEFDYFMALVDDALQKQTQQDGFSGAISVQTLPDVVQLYVLANSTGMLRVRHHSGEGAIYFQQGAVLDARTPSNVGNEAFFEIMLWRGGDFSMRMGAAPVERSITSNWQELIMESCRRIDEKRRNELPIEHESKAGWTLAPPSLGNDDDDPFADFDLVETRPDRASLARLTNEITQDNNAKERSMNIKDCLAKLNAIDGFIGAALVDAESGMLLGQEGGGSLNLEVAAAGNTEVVKAKRKVMGNLGIKDGIIEDILITLNKQYHLIRPLRSRTTLFFYVALDRTRANLAMARITLADVEKDLQV